VKPEARLQRDVIELAQLLGVMVAHFRAAQVRDGTWVTPLQGDGAGFPDLVLLSRYRVAYAELKSRYGKPTTAQQRWLDRLAHAGESVYVWRPADWDDGTIERELRGLLEPRVCRYCGEPAGRDGLCVAHTLVEAG
jgi:hypothetical protein